MAICMVINHLLGWSSKWVGGLKTLGWLVDYTPLHSIVYSPIVYLDFYGIIVGKYPMGCKTTLCGWLFADQNIKSDPNRLMLVEGIVDHSSCFAAGSS